MARNNNILKSHNRGAQWFLWLFALMLTTLVGCTEQSVLIDRTALGNGGKFIVLPFADAPGDQANGSGKVVTGAIAADLLQEPKVKLFDVGQSKLAETLEETQFHPADINDPIVAAELGRALNTEFVVTGEVIHYAPEKQANTSSVWIFKGGGTKTRNWVCLHVRIVRASDGKIVYAGHGSAVSLEGYAPAAEQACEEAFKQLGYIVNGKNEFGW